MILKLLWKNNTLLQLIAASLGSFIGFCILLISLEVYFDIKSVFKVEKELIKPDYIIINKKLSILKTLDITENAFSDEEINEIKNQDFVNEISPFISNSFEVSAYTGTNSDLPGFYTELFFEAIPNQFIDIENENWVWNQNDSLIPIIIPNDYLNLYNFGFAESQGLPQISANMIGLVSFSVQIRGNGKRDEFRGKIAGFSDRINTILVPYDFIIWANNTYGDGDKNPSRLVILAKDPSDPEILNFLSTKNYETNKEKLKNSKLNSIFKIAISVTSFISSLIIFLSLMIFILGFQLLITKSAQKIKILLNIGYKQLYISKFYIFIFALIIILINIVSILILYFIDKKLFEYFLEKGFEIKAGVNAEVLFVGIIISVMIMLLNSLSIIFKIRQINNQ